MILNLLKIAGLGVFLVILKAANLAIRGFYHFTLPVAYIFNYISSGTDVQDNKLYIKACYLTSWALYLGILCLIIRSILKLCGYDI